MIEACSYMRKPSILPGGSGYFRKDLHTDKKQRRMKKNFCLDIDS